MRFLVPVSARGRSLFERSRMECSVSVCDTETSSMRRLSNHEKFPDYLTHNTILFQLKSYKELCQNKRLDVLVE